MRTLAERYQSIPHAQGGGWNIPRKDRPLTERQRFVLDVIIAFIGEHGRPPVFRELGEMLGMVSSHGVHDAISALEAKGAIIREGHGHIRIPGVRWQMVRIEEGAKDDEQRRLDEEGAGGDR
jgi:SOS-response transcriptional repressor LexA